MVGGSFIVDHEIYAGDTQKGGEIGHMAVVPENGELCYCGKYGCFDYCLPGWESWMNTQMEIWRSFFTGWVLVMRGRCFVGCLSGSSCIEQSNNIRILFDCKVILGGYVGGLHR